MKESKPIGGDEAPDPWPDSGLTFEFRRGPGRVGIVAKVVDAEWIVTWDAESFGKNPRQSLSHMVETLGRAMRGYA